MKTLQSYSKSFSIGAKSLKLNTTIYFLYLLVALLIAIPFYKMFVSITEYSPLSSTLLEGFSATAFGELMRADGKMFLIYIKGLLPWLLAFWIIGIYFYGAIVSWVANPNGKFKLSNAFQAANKLFWSYFRLSIYVLIIQAIFAVLVYLLPVILISNENLTDAYIVRTMSIGIIIHLFFFVSIGFIADICRFSLARQTKKKVLKNLWKSFKFVIRRLGGLWLMFLLWAILPVFTIIGFIVFRKQITIDTGLLILFVFVVQQIFIWLKLLFKIQKQGMLFNYYILNLVAD